jgi:hypothetical protein
MLRLLVQSSRPADKRGVPPVAESNKPPHRDSFVASLLLAFFRNEGGSGNRSPLRRDSNGHYVPCLCERGQSYCPGDCKEVRRGEQLRRAAARYQRSRRGALKHAARQRRYRQRRRERPTPAKRVTHHTSARVGAGGTVAGSPVTVVSESADDPETSEAAAPETCASARAPPGRLYCAFCHRPLDGLGPGVEGHAGGAASA